MPKKYFKKTLAGIFAVAIVASAVPLAPYTKVLNNISISASAAAANEDDFTFDAKTGTITGYKGSEADIVIPSSINGVTVTAIGGHAFQYGSAFKSFVIPDTVTSIGESAFGSCSSLTSIYIPKSVTSIDRLAFYSCSSLEEFNVDDDNTAFCDDEGILFNADSTRLIQYPEQKADISYTVPSTVTSIGESAFANCVYLQDLTLSDSVVRIGNDAIRSCSALTSVTAPCNLKHSQNYWLRDFKGDITYSHIDDGSGICYCSQEVPYQIVDGIVLGYYGEGGELVIPEKIYGETVTGLGDGAFHDAKLTSVVMPDTITTIGYHAFLNCSALESITLSESLEMIGNGAFENCSTLTSITLTDSVKRVDYGAFKNCSALEEITLSDALEVIGSNAFDGCSALTNITIPDSVTEIGNSVFNNCSNLAAISAPCTLKRNNTLISAADNGIAVTFSHVSDVEDGFCDGCRYIRGMCGAWNWSTGIRDDVSYVFDIKTGTLTISGTGVISENAFNATFNNNGFENQIKDVVIEDGITRINVEAFYGCPSLASITLPDTLESIAPDALSECESLKSITAPCTLQLQAGIVSAVNEYGAVLTLNHLSDADDDDTCDRCRYITGSCGEYNEETGEYDDNVTFSFNPKTGVLTISGTGKIGEYAFCIDYDELGIANAIKEVVIENGVTEIGGAAFCGCENMESITIPDSVNTIGDEAFVMCSTLENITIPESVTVIGGYTFAGSGLKTITFEGDEVTEISDGAFSYCENMESITIPDSVKTIGHEAFAMCSTLESITIPESVTEIGACVFAGSGLKTITFECDDESAIQNFTYDFDYDEGAFISCSLEAIYVPEGCADAYWNSKGYQSLFTYYDADDNLIDGRDLIQEVSMAKAKGISVAYNGDVTINFHYSVSDSYKNGYVKFNGSDEKVYLTDKKDEKGYYILPISMPAKNMYDEITAQFYDANDEAVGDAVTYDLVTYMDKVKAYNASYTKFVDSFLEYGKQAAAYFGNTNAPVSTKTYDYDSILSQLETEGYNVLPDMDSNYVGATMLLKSTPILRLYYKEAINGLDLGDNGAWDTNEKNADLTFIQKEISAAHFSTTFNGYSVYHYFYKAFESGDEKLMKLCAALYEFSIAASGIMK